MFPVFRSEEAKATVQRCMSSSARYRRLFELLEVDLEELPQRTYSSRFMNFALERNGLDAAVYVAMVMEEMATPVSKDDRHLTQTSDRLHVNISVILSMTACADEMLAIVLELIGPRVSRIDVIISRTNVYDVKRRQFMNYGAQIQPDSEHRQRWLRRVEQLRTPSLRIDNFVVRDDPGVWKPPDTPGNFVANSVRSEGGRRDPDTPANEVGNSVRSEGVSGGFHNSGVVEGVRAASEEGPQASPAPPPPPPPRGRPDVLLSIDDYDPTQTEAFIPLLRVATCVRVSVCENANHERLIDVFHHAGSAAGLILRVYGIDLIPRESQATALAIDSAPPSLATAFASLTSFKFTQSVAFDPEVLRSLLRRNANLRELHARANDMSWLSEIPPQLETLKLELNGVYEARTLPFPLRQNVPGLRVLTMNCNDEGWMVPLLACCPNLESLELLKQVSDKLPSMIPFLASGRARSLTMHGFPSPGLEEAIEEHSAAPTLVTFKQLAPGDSTMRRGGTIASAVARAHGATLRVLHLSATPSQMEPAVVAFCPGLRSLRFNVVYPEENVAALQRMVAALPELETISTTKIVENSSTRASMERIVNEENERRRVLVRDRRLWEGLLAEVERIREKPTTACSASRPKIATLPWHFAGLRNRVDAFVGRAIDKELRWI